jgi:polyhydroxyalkanoate synthesis regulator phasin
MTETRLDDRRSLTEQLEKAWSQALGAVSAVEDEASRWVHRWAGAAGIGPDEVRRHAGEWAERLAGQRRELERFVDEGVRRALARVKLPKREEVQELERRLGSLSHRVEALSRRDA